MFLFSQLYLLGVLLDISYIELKNSNNTNNNKIKQVKMSNQHLYIMVGEKEKKLEKNK